MHGLNRWQQGNTSGEELQRTLQAKGSNKGRLHRSDASRDEADEQLAQRFELGGLGEIVRGKDDQASLGGTVGARFTSIFLSGTTVTMKSCAAMCSPSRSAIDPTNQQITHGVSDHRLTGRTFHPHSFMAAATLRAEPHWEIPELEKFCGGHVNVEVFKQVFFRTGNCNVVWLASKKPGGRCTSMHTKKMSIAGGTRKGLGLVFFHTRRMNHSHGQKVPLPGRYFSFIYTPLAPLLLRTSWNSGSET